MVRENFHLAGKVREVVAIDVENLIVRPFQKLVHSPKVFNSDTHVQKPAPMEESLAVFSEGFSQARFKPIGSGSCGCNLSP